MATIEADRVAEARLLLHQALRLLEGPSPAPRDATARRVLHELAADLARDAIELLATDPSAANVPPSESRHPGWAG